MRSRRMSFRVCAVLLKIAMEDDQNRDSDGKQSRSWISSGYRNLRPQLWSFLLLIAKSLGQRTLRTNFNRRSLKCIHSQGKNGGRYRMGGHFVPQPCWLGERSAHPRAVSSQKALYYQQFLANEIAIFNFVQVSVKSRNCNLTCWSMQFIHTNAQHCALQGSPSRECRRNLLLLTLTSSHDSSPNFLVLLWRYLMSEALKR